MYDPLENNRMSLIQKKQDIQIWKGSPSDNTQTTLNRSWTMCSQYNIILKAALQSQDIFVAEYPIEFSKNSFQMP